MQHFKISPEGANKIISKTRPRTIAIFSMAVITGLILSIKSNQQDEAKQASLYYIIPFILAVMIWAYLRGVKRRKTLLGSFVITITEDDIIRQQLDTPLVTISRNGVKEILKDKSGNLVIKGNDGKNTINVPVEIDDFSELATSLHQIKPIIEQNPYSILDRYPIPVGLLTITLFLSVYLSTNKIIVGVTGALLLALLIWSLYQVHRSRHIDDNTKKRGYLVLLAMVSIAATMVFKLAGIMGY
jgi:hypothetical protein